MLEGHVGEVCPGRNSSKRDATCAAALPPPRPAMSNAFKRDLGAGRMQPSRRRGDSKAERGAGEGGTARGERGAAASSCNGATFFFFFLHGRSRSRALFRRGAHKEPALPAVMRVAQLALRTQPARFHSFTAQRFPLPRPSEQDPASYQRSSCHAALLRALPAGGQSRWQRRIISFPTRAVR